MRITKKFLREAKAAMYCRIRELTGLEDHVWLTGEFKKCFPYAESTAPIVEQRRMLFALMVEKAIPSYVCD